MGASYIFTTLANVIFTIIEALLGLRIILRLFSANPATPFVQWVYETSETLIAPFRGIFPSPSLREGFILDIPALFALLIYALIAYMLFQLIDYINFRSTSRTTVIEEDDRRVVNRRRR